MLDRFGNWYPDFPGQQPQQDPAFMQMLNQSRQGGAQQASQPTQQPQPAQQMMTPPTIRAEIMQMDDMAAIDRFPMGAGTTQMFITKDDQHIVIRSMYANGQHADKIYDQRPPEPPAPTLNPRDYVRKDELMPYLVEAIAGMQKRQETAKEDDAQ